MYVFYSSENECWSAYYLKGISEQKAKRVKYETNHERAKRWQLHCMDIIMKLHLRIHIHPDLKIIKIKASSPYKNPNLRKTIEGY